jgi:hypothetical protein
MYSDFFIFSVFVKCLIIAGVQENLNGLGGDFDFVFYTGFFLIGFKFVSTT